MFSSQYESGKQASASLIVEQHYGTIKTNMQQVAGSFSLYLDCAAIHSMMVTGLPSRRTG